MHTRYILLSTFLLMGICGSQTSCKKYLDAPVDDQQTPVTVADYTALLNGEGWNQSQEQLSNDQVSFNFLEMMTADADESIPTNPTAYNDEKALYSAFYTWQNKYDVQKDDRQSPSYILNSTWLGLYRMIQVCNNISAAAGSIKGDSAYIRFLLGETCFTRALAYYFLVNIWSPPYDPALANNMMGVPLKTDNRVESILLPRASQEQVYHQILKDLTDALQFVRASGKTGNAFHYSDAAICLLLSRVHLYQQHWQLAAAYADTCLQLRPVLADISDKYFSIYDPVSYFFGPDNPEIIYSFFNPANTGQPRAAFGTGQNYGYRVAPDLLQLYEAGDQRLGAFFYYFNTTNNVIIPKTSPLPYPPTQYACYSFRTAEAYLNRAESNANMGHIAIALQDINILRAHRIKNATAIPLTDKKSALEAILTERHRELAFQLHGWFDNRRTSMPAIVHYFTPVSNNQVFRPQKFVLHAKDPGYTLEIPGKVLQSNPAIKPLALPPRMPE